jgi:predicted DCC family thiol-disulfide oxidoreductase YuxK
MRHPPFDLEVFFDGDCPLCRREIALLTRLDRGSRIRFVDLARMTPDDFAGGPDRSARMRSIHARTAHGDWVVGVEVFRRLYETVGWGGVVGWTRWAPIDAMLRVLYDVFARNRLRLTGRSGSGGCDQGVCGVTEEAA